MAQFNPLVNLDTSSPARIREQIPCPRCGKGMRLMTIEPAPPALTAYLITYRCGICNYQEKHIRQRTSANAHPPSRRDALSRAIADLTRRD